ncbi:MAG: hypothetical protein Q7R35_10885 [Elusimicrobiota bacterium]|nr:hypothetical protein [Elusimicrobiota bacterium]
MKRFLIIAAALACACQVWAGQDDLAGRLEWFKASVPAARRVTAPPASAAELETAARTAAKIYSDFLPSGYRTAISYHSRPTWNDMLSWYKATSQELMLMGREAARLAGACKTAGERKAAGETVRAALKAAEGFLKFIDTTSWPEALRGPMTGEMRAAHVKALKDWRALAACCSIPPGKK